MVAEPVRGTDRFFRFYLRDLTASLILFTSIIDEVHVRAASLCSVGADTISPESD